MKIVRSLLMASALITTLAFIPVPVNAGFMKIWQIREISAAPVLAVVRVVAVVRKERIPEGSLAWKAETWAMTADVEVLRSFVTPGATAASGRIQIHFLAYGPSVTGFVNGTPPPLPAFEPGKVLLLPLRENSGADEESVLIADQGSDLTIPVRGEYVHQGALPEASAQTGRDFVIREIANTLSRGVPAELAAVSSWLATKNENLAGELMPLLEGAIGDERGRWAEIATNILAGQGIPRPKVAELLRRSGQLSSMLAPPARGAGQSDLLAQKALGKLGASPETDALLIRTWIANSPWCAWGAANSLLEFGDNAVTSETLRQALHDDVRGASYIAWILVRNGHGAVLHEALIHALQVVDHPRAERDSPELQGAAALLRDYGSSQQLQQLAEIVGKYQTRDRTWYQVLWQYATESGNPREARVLSVILRDQRVMSGELRNCDYAVGMLERALHQAFGSGGKTLAERDTAVSKALAWIQLNGFPV